MSEKTTGGGVWRPVNLRPWQVNALKEGRLTQIWVLMKPQPTRINDPQNVWQRAQYQTGCPVFWNGSMKSVERPLFCPLGAVGGRLYGREPWAAFTTPTYEYGESDEIECAPSDMAELYGVHPWEIAYRADGDSIPSRWRSASTMPRWASRWSLEIVAERVQQVQEITEEGARKCGIMDGGCRNCGESEPCGCPSPTPSARDAFSWEWMAQHGYDAWQRNGWAWVADVRQIDPTEGK